jgi:lipoate-protein ligase A
MRSFSCTRPTPAANLACDEALLNDREARGGPGVLRFWESTDYFIVVGYAARVAEEVDLEACRALDIPVLRRCSGGGTVLQGPGCLNYSLVLPLSAVAPDDTATIPATNRFVMERHQEALTQLLGQPVAVAGHTDLILGDRKFSGNAQRRRREWFLFHGTFLLDFKLDLIGRTLRPPPRQPAYRQQRDHGDFLTSLRVSPEAIQQALRSAWSAEVPTDAEAEANEAESRRLDLAIDALVRERYSCDAWNLR